MIQWREPLSTSPETPCETPQELDAKAFAPPSYQELKEIPRLRKLAQMSADHLCFTNGLCAVTEAYELGWKAALTSGMGQEPTK